MFLGLTEHGGVISTVVPDSPHKIFIGGLPNYLNEDQVSLGGRSFLVGDELSVVCVCFQYLSIYLLLDICVALWFFPLLLEVFAFFVRFVRKESTQQKHSAFFSPHIVCSKAGIFGFTQQQKEAHRHTHKNTAPIFRMHCYY